MKIYHNEACSFCEALVDEVLVIEEDEWEGEERYLCEVCLSDIIHRFLKLENLSMSVFIVQR
ncbi:hypothetical protein ER57_11560 [Smithella sp. SCADC]|jgi:hypothetical protein|nr:hypothetical protein ER57_11560 [Smithella sp. SCADC]